MRNKLPLLYFLILCLACQEKDKEIAQKVNHSSQPCIHRKHLEFEKNTPITDPLLIEYLKPRDSVLNITASLTKPFRTISESNASSRKIWYSRGIPARILVESNLDNHTIILQYIILDPCNWIYEKSTFDQENKDSLCTLHHYYFEGSELKNAFVSSGMLHHLYYTNLIENPVALVESERILKQFRKELDLFVY